jgi:hypothetical protein
MTTAKTLILIALVSSLAACGGEDACTAPPEAIDVPDIGTLELRACLDLGEGREGCIYSTDPDNTAPIGTTVCETVGSRDACDMAWRFAPAECFDKGPEDA